MTFLTFFCNSNANRAYQFIIHSSIGAFSAFSYGDVSPYHSKKKKNQ